MNVRAPGRAALLPALAVGSILGFLVVWIPWLGIVPAATVIIPLVVEAMVHRRPATLGAVAFSGGSSAALTLGGVLLQTALDPAIRASPETPLALTAAVAIACCGLILIRSER